MTHSVLCNAVTLDWPGRMAMLMFGCIPEEFVGICGHHALAQPSPDQGHRLQVWDPPGDKLPLISVIVQF